VSSIEPGSKFAGTDLRSGMIVEKINGMTLKGRDSLPAMRILYNSVGDIEVEARALDMVVACSNSTSSTGGAEPTIVDKVTGVDSKTKTKDADGDHLGINLVRDVSTGKYYIRDWWPGDSTAGDEQQEGEGRTTRATTTTTTTTTDRLHFKSGMLAQVLSVNGITVTGKPTGVVLSLLQTKNAPEDVEITLSWDHKQDSSSSCCCPQQRERTAAVAGEEKKKKDLSKPRMSRAYGPATDSTRSFKTPNNQ
jgi:hypothetical protein